MGTHTTDDFERIGSRLVVRDDSQSPPARRAPFGLDVRSDRRGREYFQLDHRVRVEVAVLDVRPTARHLLMTVTDGSMTRAFLCGHDERHYFAAGVDPNARDIDGAMLTLQPEPVRAVAAALPSHQRFTRHNPAFKRQGEWFFVRARGVWIDKCAALRNEPIRRGASKPHLCQYLRRLGGKAVWFHPRHAPNGIGTVQYRALDRGLRQADGWRQMARDAEVYVKGSVSHPDHRTLILHGWHRVYLNGEVLSEELVFLD